MSAAYVWRDPQRLAVARAARRRRTLATIPLRPLSQAEWARLSNAQRTARQMAWARHLDALSCDNTPAGRRATLEAALADPRRDVA